MAGTGMIDAMAKSAMTAVPDRFGSWLGPINRAAECTADVSRFSNDAYYFGVVPVIAQNRRAVTASRRSKIAPCLAARPAHPRH